MRQDGATKEMILQIKTNIRAGAGANAGGVNAGGAGGHNSSKLNNTVVSYVPPVILGRCIGIVSPRRS
jgi:hypothetical protein